jgi:hypothetical protein
MYRSNAGLGEVELGQWLGVSHQVGLLMLYWIFLPASGIPISVSTVKQMTNNKRRTDKQDAEPDNELQ